MPVEESKATVSRVYEEARSKGKLRTVDELVAPDFFDHHHRQGDPENLKRIIRSLRSTFLDMRFVLEDQIAEGDRVASRWTLRGIDKGGLLGLPPTGERATFGGISIDRVASEDRRLLGTIRHAGLSTAAGSHARSRLMHGLYSACPS
jgi:predicted ester cyclase